METQARPCHPRVMNDNTLGKKPENGRHDPARLDPAYYPLRFVHRILYADMDGFRHLNNGATGRYFEEGRAALNMRIFGADCMIDPKGGLQLLFASQTTDFLRQAHYPGVVEIGTGIAKLGTSSYRLMQGAFQNGECFALGEVAMVKAIDGRPAPISDDERALAQALMFGG